MTLYTVGSRGNVASLDINEIVQVLTGTMPDQPVTLTGGVVVTAPLTVIPLVSPTISSVIPTGAGSVVRSYQIVARNTAGDAPPGPQLLASTPSTLNGSNTALITWSATPAAGMGSTSFVVLRNGQRIGIVTFVTGQTTYTFVDNGQTGIAYTAISFVAGVQQAIRFVGAISGGVPGGYSAAQGDVIIDKTGGRLWTCYAAGNPGKWVASGPGTWRMHMHQAQATLTTTASGYFGANLDTIDDDPNGNCDTTGYRWQCPQTGWYRVSGAIAMGIASTTDPAIIYGCLYDQNGSAEVIRGTEFCVRGGIQNDGWVSVLAGRVFLYSGHWYRLAIYNLGPFAMSIYGSATYCFLDIEFTGLL